MGRWGDEGFAIDDMRCETWDFFGHDMHEAGSEGTEICDIGLQF